MPHEPKRRHSRQRKGKRRASISLKPTHKVVCKNCGENRPPHSVCQKCGFYKGKLAVSPKVKKNKPKA